MEPADIITSSSDHELQEKIGRLKAMLLKPITACLPDKGEKIRLQLRQCEDELDHRHRTPTAPPARVSDKDGEGCERMDRSKCAESSGSIEEAEESPSSFAKLFCKRFEPKLGSSLLKNKSKASDKKDNAFSNKKNDKKVSGTNDKKDEDVLLLNEQNEKEKEKNVPLKNGTSKSSGSSVSAQKRRKIIEIGDSTTSRSKVINEPKEDKEVVLLDEEITPAEAKKDEIEWVEARACYPSSEDPEMVELSCSDLKCLEPEEYLSSPVMNFYNMYLQRHLSPAGTQRVDCHFFNTYFYNKLEEAFSPKGKKNELFSKLRRWWKGVNIFQKAYIFMPVYGDMHWSLVIICIPPDDDNSGPIVLHLDSLVYHNSIAIFDVINNFLKEEWMCMEHNNTPNKRRRNLPRKIENKIVKVPQQDNDYDCGLFVLYFMERFYEKAPERLRKKDLSLFGVKWFEKCNALGLRKRIKSLLLEVFENSKLEISTSKPKSTSNSENEEDDS